jgi:MFS family permease
MTLTGKFDPFPLARLSVQGSQHVGVDPISGLIHNYHGLLACRFFLGVREAGIFPACVYYVTSWYPRKDDQYRTALFYASASLA